MSRRKMMIKVMPGRVDWYPVLRNDGHNRIWVKLTARAFQRIYLNIIFNIIENKYICFFRNVFESLMNFKYFMAASVFFLSPARNIHLQQWSWNVFSWPAVGNCLLKCACTPMQLLSANYFCNFPNGNIFFINLRTIWNEDVSRKDNWNLKLDLNVQTIR